MRQFFIQYHFNDLTHLHEWHKQHKFSLDVKHSWELAFLSGNENIFQPFLIDQPYIDQLTERFGANIAHYAAWSGKSDCLSAVLKKFPSLINSMGEYGVNIAHSAAWSGHADFLFAVLKKSPQLKLSSDDLYRNIAHHAAFSGNSECLFAVLKKFPSMEKSTDIDGANIAHFAAESGNLQHLFSVLEKFPKLKSSVNYENENIACYAALSGDPDYLFIVLKTFPELVSRPDDAARIGCFAAESGNPDCLFAVLKEYPKVKDYIYPDNCSIIHYVAYRRDADYLKTVLLHYPEFIVTLENSLGEIDAKIDVPKVIREVKTILGQQWLPARVSSSSSAQRAQAPDPLFDAVKPDENIIPANIANEPPDELLNASLTEDAKTHIHGALRVELQKLRDNGVRRTDIRQALQLLQEYPFDTTHHAGRENDKQLQAIFAGNDCDLVYYILHPQLLSTNIQPAQISAAKTHFMAMLAEEEKKLAAEIKASMVKKKVTTVVKRKVHRSESVSSSSSSVVNHSLFAPVVDELPREDAPIKNASMLPV